MDWTIAWLDIFHMDGSKIHSLISDEITATSKFQQNIMDTWLGQFWKSA